MQQLDAHLFRLINGHLASRVLDPVMLAVTAIGTGLVQAAICLAMVWVGWLRCLPVFRRAGYAGLIACAAAALASPIVKALVSRPRPLLAIYDVRVVGDPLFTNSFPSGHSTAAFAVAVALAAFLPRLRWVCLALAALVGVSRVYVGAHFPMDVVGGAALGAMVGLLSAWVVRANSSGGRRMESGKQGGAIQFPYLVLAGLCLVLFLWGLGAVPLVGLDESMYAESAREMAAGGNWIVPHFNGEPFFDKPPLGYWLMAASMRAFGANSFAARLPSALAGLVLIALTVALGTRLYGRRAGVLAGFVLTSCMLTAGLARMAVLDMLFALAITAALGTFLLSYLSLLPRWGYLLFWAATGISVMVKGPAGAALIFITVGVFLAIRRRPGQFRRMSPVVGVLILAMVALPWYAAVQRETGGAFLREFVVHQNIERALGKDFHHNMPFYFYLPIYVVGFFPWSVFVPVAWAGRVRLKPADPEQEAAFFAAVWIAAMVAVFSIARSKLPAYIYPVYAPSALLVAAAWARAMEDSKEGSMRGSALAALLVAAPVGAAMLIGPRFLPRPIPGIHAALVPMGIALILGPALAFVFARMHRPGPAFGALCGGMVVFALTATTVGLPVASRTIGDPGVHVGNAVRAMARPGEVVVAYQLGTSLPSLPFYARRPVPAYNEASPVRAIAESGKAAIVVAREDRLEGLPTEWRPARKMDRFVLFRFPGSITPRTGSRPGRASSSAAGS